MSERWRRILRRELQRAQYIVAVLVWPKGNRRVAYHCEAIYHPGLYRCGVCVRSLVEARRGSRCANCGARVCGVKMAVDRNEQRIIERLVYERWLRIHHPEDWARRMGF